MSTSVEGRNVFLQQTQAIPLALVINELITNAFKHGIGSRIDGALRIVIRENSQHVLIAVADNGLAELDTDGFSKKEHLGFEIIRRLIQGQLDGNFRILRHDGWTWAIAVFPKKQAGGGR